MQRTKNRSHKVLWMLVVLLLGVTPMACGGHEFRASGVPGGGAYSVDEGSPTSVVFQNVSFAQTQTTTTIMLTGFYFDTNGGLVNVFVQLIVPNNIYGQDIDLADSGSTLTETGTSTFSTASVEGTVNLRHISPPNIDGAFSATFIDAADSTRSIEDGSFVVNDFDSHI